MVKNPFTFGNPVIDQSLFFGRKSEITQITNRLLSSGHESTSLIGDSRMGNTSLLKYLSNPVSAAELGLHPDSYSPLYIDFQGQPEITPDRFWKRVFATMKRSAQQPEIKELAGEYRKMEEFDIFDLEDFFDEISDMGITIVLLMDEFEYVTQSPNIRGDFFGGLRSLAIHSNLSLVPATRRELADLVHSEELKGSPFFNIFASVNLRPFSSEDSRQMLDYYLSRSENHYTEEEKAYLATLGDGHPYFLQMAGYYWFFGKEDGLEGQELCDYIFDNYYQQSLPHLKDLWSICDRNEKSILQTVASKRKADLSSLTIRAVTLEKTKYRDPIENLIKRGLLNEREGDYVINLPCLERFLDEVIDSEIEKELFSRKPFAIAEQPRSRPHEFDVFISHSTKDKPQADLLVRGLESRGIACWIVPRNINPGTPYPEADNRCD